MQGAFREKKVAVIGAANMIYGVENLESIIDLPIQKYILDDITASDRTVDQAANDGCKIVISGLNTNKYAERIGLQTMLVETGKNPSARRSLKRSAWRLSAGKSRRRPSAIRQFSTTRMKA